MLKDFFIKDRLIRILDVASGTYLHDIHMAKFSWITSIRVNSNYVVINGGNVCMCTTFKP